MNEKYTCKFKYNHKKTIEGIKDNQEACTVIVNIPNEYLQSLVEITNAQTFRFVEKGKSYSDYDKVKLDETNAVIIGYNCYSEGKNYFKKILIEDQSVITVEKTVSDDNIISINISQDNDTGG